ncbi:hypothetical protein PGT21_017334 [Puccinia graminis f. sp. tritici]|uniref:Uncharacterized protein n=2 Tax=Puccinia graminis f. sp. tritici TaxID=56615 RepID=A0A5B0Q321_PUCGR|nr:hypothetical protein PGT21_017334 [Puccinia graminis f. sp. tritici]
MDASSSGTAACNGSFGGPFTSSLARDYHSRCFDNFNPSSPPNQERKSLASRLSPSSHDAYKLRPSLTLFCCLPNTPLSHLASNARSSTHLDRSTQHSRYSQALPSNYLKLPTKLNLDMSPSQPSDALAEALLDLSRKCQELRQQKGHKQEGKATDLKIRQDSLSQIQTTLLPAARNSVVELYKALDLALKKSASPQPQYNDALAIVPSLSKALVNLSLSANNLDPKDEKFGLNDQNSGPLKKFRIENLQQEISELISIFLSDVFEEISELLSSGDFTNSGHDGEPAQPHASIDMVEDSFNRIIHLVDLSDFGLLQSLWQEDEEEVGHLLVIINREVSIAQHPDLLDDQGFSHKVTPRLVKLLEQCNPLIKSCRGFYRKIASADLFTISEKKSTVELESIVHHSAGIKQSLQHIVHALTSAAVLQRVEQVRGTQSHLHQFKKSVDDTLETLASHMTPSDPSAKVDEVMDKLFGHFKSTLYPAISQFTSDFSEFESSL